MINLIKTNMTKDEQRDAAWEAYQAIQSELAVFWDEIANNLPKSKERAALGDEQIFNAFAATYPKIRKHFTSEREAVAKEEREKIKSLLRGREPSPKTDFDSKEEYQIHCQKIGAINWYSNLIKGQIDLSDKLRP